MSEESTLWQVINRPTKANVIEERFKTLHTYAQQCFPGGGDFALEWLANVLIKIDEVYYDDRLLSMVKETYGDLHLDYGDEHADETEAGYVDEPDGLKITLSMNRALFMRLFQNHPPSTDQYGYHSGGLLCRDRLVCFLHVLLHETVHLALTLLARRGFRKDRHHHGRVFHRIVAGLFGQTDAQNGLIKGFKQAHDVQQLRKLIRVGSEVEIFLNGEWHPAIVERSGRIYIHVVMEGKRAKVHIGLTRLVH
jgi:hypothetical protein